uniref:Uncharacterized protein n=1 Tax=Oryza punctata TaxID=4537 RepID=A0A0E0M0H3_ORYPU
MVSWRLTVVVGERCAPERRTTISRWLRRRCCFGPRCRTLGSTFTSKEVFTGPRATTDGCSTCGRVGVNVKLRRHE